MDSAVELWSGVSRNTYSHQLKSGAEKHSALARNIKRVTNSPKVIFGVYKDAIFILTVSTWAFGKYVSPHLATLSLSLAAGFVAWKVGRAVRGFLSARMSCLVATMAAAAVIAGGPNALGALSSFLAPTGLANAFVTRLPAFVPAAWSLLNQSAIPFVSKTLIPTLASIVMVTGFTQRILVGFVKRSATTLKKASEECEKAGKDPAHPIAPWVDREIRVMHRVNQIHRNLPRGLAAWDARLQIVHNVARVEQYIRKAMCRLPNAPYARGPLQDSQKLIRVVNAMAERVQREVQDTQYSGRFVCSMNLRELLKRDPQGFSIDLSDDEVLATLRQRIETLFQGETNFQVLAKTRIQLVASKNGAAGCARLCRGKSKAQSVKREHMIDLHIKPLVPVSNYVPPVPSDVMMPETLLIKPTRELSSDYAGRTQLSSAARLLSNPRLMMQYCRELEVRVYDEMRKGRHLDVYPKQVTVTAMLKNRGEAELLDVLFYGIEREILKTQQPDLEKRWNEVMNSSDQTMALADLAARYGCPLIRSLCHQRIAEHHLKERGDINAVLQFCGHQFGADRGKEYDLAQYPYELHQLVKRCHWLDIMTLPTTEAGRDVYDEKTKN